MARSRNLKPGFFSNEILAECQPLARILFQGLWCIADREGRLEDRPKKIKAEILPYDNCDVDLLLNELADKTEPDGSPAFIIRYAAEGRGYIQVINFKKHQNPHVKEATSNIPAPDPHHTSTVLTPDKNRTSPADSLLPITDSLNPITTTDSPSPDDRASSFDTNQIEDDLRRSRHVFEAYEQEFGRLLSRNEIETIEAYLKEYSPELIVHALKVGIAQGHRTLGYIRGILTNWAGLGIKSVQDAEEHERQFRDQKQKQQQKAADADKAKKSISSEYEIYVPPPLIVPNTG